MQRFLRGNLYYDEALGWFKWNRPAGRYGRDDLLLDPARDGAEIQMRIQQSPAGTLLEYRKAL